MIFPEGATTNGKYIIKFKKGAFASLKPVKPYISKVRSLTNGVDPVRGDSLSFLASSVLILISSHFKAQEHIELPVFAPNEYFWKNHWDGKEENQKVEVFAEAVRQVMAEAGGMKLSDSDMQDKMDYKKIVWGKEDKYD